MKHYLFAILLVLGYACFALAFVCGIGYALYLFGVAEVAVGKAMWSGFILWAQMLVGGIVTSAVGYVGIYINDK